ncbi:MAG: 4-hydroxythreonine-4-phosphate dehydrogenase PdxA [Sphingomonadales bacterium]|nr:4-hydroxythreonine-4-phosphate dehydrogenase PdxA [Sphingomonadales bacterium]
MTAPLVVSLGDPAGIGPELIAAAWSRREGEGLPPFFVAGGRTVLENVARELALNVPVVPIENVEDAVDVFARGLPVLGAPGCSWRPGKPDTEGAWLAYDSLKWATALAREGLASGIVTGPIAKAHLAAIGFVHPGQTEFVAEACGVAPEDAVMMLAGPSLRTVPLTVHLALAEVPGALTVELIRRRCTIVAAALQRDFGIPNPRLAVAALNPHASEDGRFGDEEARIIAPAVAALQAAGIAVTGPHPADALFAPHARGDYDVALCMYHDQALIPLKALDFDNGVNVTLGLPVIRTSPDHGTAFAIAGQRKANPGATIAALRMAGECAVRRAAE